MTGGWASSRRASLSTGCRPTRSIWIPAGRPDASTKTKPFVGSEPIWAGPRNTAGRCGWGRTKPSPSWAGPSVRGRTGRNCGTASCRRRASSGGCTATTSSIPARRWRRSRRPTPNPSASTGAGRRICPTMTWPAATCRPGTASTDAAATPSAGRTTAWPNETLNRSSGRPCSNRSPRPNRPLQHRPPRHWPRRNRPRRNRCRCPSPPNRSGRRTPSPSTSRHPAG